MRFAHIAGVCVAVLLGQATIASAAADRVDRVDRVLSLLPPETRGIILSPHLDRLGDDAGACLAGMDRAGLLLTTRPLDQFKSMAGIPMQINDHGAAAAAWVIHPDKSAAAFILVPVTDAEAFLHSNFEPGGEEHAYLHSAGVMLYARSFGSHVALSRDRAVLSYEPIGPEGARQTLAQLGSDGEAILGSSDLIAFGDGAATLGAIGNAVALLEKLPVPEMVKNGVATLANGLADGGVTAGVEMNVLAVDFDPLGIVLRSMMRFEDGTLRSRIAAGGAAGRDGLACLPRKPFYLVASADLAGLGGTAAMQRLNDVLRIVGIRDWLSTATGFRFIASPSPAGLAGGLLNDAMLIVDTGDPEGARDFVRQRILAREHVADGITRRVTWRADKPVEDAGAADAYEVRAIEVPPEQNRKHIVRSLIFGRMGWRGFVRAVDEGLIVTFSQRPSLLRGAMEATVGTGDGLAEDGVIRTMRMWMPRDRDVEIYVDPGRILNLLEQAAGAYPLISELPLPQIDGQLTPVGLGAALDGGAVQTTMILPADVAAVLLDQAMQHLPEALRKDQQESSEDEERQ